MKQDEIKAYLADKDLWIHWDTKGFHISSTIDKPELVIVILEGLIEKIKGAKK
jgi:hypothetical protein